MTEYEPLTFGDSSDGGTTEKKRRYSVHDVEAEDNEVNYGQPDNPADDGNAIRIGSTSDDNVTTGDRSSMNRSSIHSDSHKSQEDDDNPNIYIHENVDDNDEYANEHIAVDPNQYNEDFTTDEQQTGSGSNARDSKENTPDQEDKKKHFDTSHYRHPSLAPHENPASDDDDIDKDHGRYLSTLIHEVNDS